MRLGSVRGGSNQRFRDEAFPTLSSDRMTEQSFFVPDAQQRMGNAAVAHIHLWGLDQPFSDVAMPRGQTAHKQKVNQQVEIAGDGFTIHAQSTRQRGGVE